MSKPKRNFISLCTLGLLLFTLPLLGFGCSGGQSAPSVSEKADTAQTDKDEPSLTDEKPDTKPTAQDDDSASDTPASQSELPEGWKWYESNLYKIKFGYPGEWHIAEFVGGSDGFYVFLADKEIQLAPEPMTPITVQFTSESFEQTRAELMNQDPNLTSDVVMVNGVSTQRIRYRSDVFGVFEYVYGLDGALVWHIDNDKTREIALKVISTYIKGDAP